MRRMRTGLMALALLVACAAPGRAQTVLGTGSAFAQPIYARWAEQARGPTGIQVNYQAAGSSVGQNQVLKGLTDFGASDVPMEDAKLRQADILQFPTVVGGLAVVVNLPGIRSGELRLTGAVLAAIYTGAITRWDDARIAGLNPGLGLPNLPVAPFYHAGGSGSTYAIARYLAKVSEAWRDRMGVGMTLNWPVGAGVKGSYGAATAVSLTPGGIGYAEYSYVAANRLTAVRLRNQAGRFVASDGESFAAAAESADWTAAPNFSVDLTDRPGEHSWPIVSATFVLIPRDPAKAATSEAARTFFAWAFANGDEAARALHYVPLPGAVKAEIERSWKR